MKTWSNLGPGCPQVCRAKMGNTIKDQAGCEPGETSMCLEGSRSLEGGEHLSQRPMSLPTVRNESSASACVVSHREGLLKCTL